MTEQTIGRIIASVIVVGVYIYSMLRWCKRQAAETERWLREEGC